jgi:hypothetical protein
MFVLLTNQCYNIYISYKMGACNNTKSKPTGNSTTDQEQAQAQGQSSEQQCSTQVIKNGDVYINKQGGDEYKIHFDSEGNLRVECTDKDGTTNNLGKYDDLGNHCFKLTLTDSEGVVEEVNIVIEDRAFSFKGTIFTKV